MLTLKNRSLGLYQRVRNGTLDAPSSPRVRGSEEPRSRGADDAASKVVAGGAASVLPAVTGSRDSVRSEPVQERLDRRRGVRARVTLPRYIYITATIPAVEICVSNPT